MTNGYKVLSALSLSALLSLSAAAEAKVYLFTANCSGGKVVEQWTTDTVDPGKELLKAKTEEKHPGCPIADYKAATDSMLLKNTQFYTVAGEAPAGSNIPVVGSVVGGTKNAFCGIFSC
jgi:hypothetical protein